MIIPRARLFAAAALAAAAAAPLSAQVPLNPRSLGVAGSYIALARGQESLWENPANLGLAGSPHWSFGIPTVSFGADVLGLTIGDLNDLRDYGDLSQARRDEILAAIPAGGTDLRADVRLPLVAAQIRSVAFGLSYNTLGNHTFDKVLVDLLLNDVDASRIPAYQAGIRNTAGFRATYVDFAAAYGRRVGPVSLGATAHYYYGRSISRSSVTSVTAVLPPANIDLLVTYDGVDAEGGNGFGLDVGAAFQATPTLTLSAAVSNALSTFDWSDDLSHKTVTLNRNDYQNGDFGEIYDRYQLSKEEDFTPNTDTLRALAAELDRDTGLPRLLRAGAAWQAATGTQVTASFQTDLSDSRLVGLWDTNLGVGVQQRLAFLSLRAGAATDLDSGALFSGGVTLGPVNFGIARVSGGDRSGWVGTFGLSTASNSKM